LKVVSVRIIEEVVRRICLEMVEDELKVNLDLGFEFPTKNGV